MKKLLSYVVFILLAKEMSAQNEHTYFPDYDAVVNKYFDAYTFSNAGDTSVLHFEKKPDGWHITLCGYHNLQTPFKDELFWSGKEKKYLAINYEKTNDSSVNIDQRNAFKTSWDKLNYTYCAFYGYPGWCWDVIEHYKNAENLPDTILYGLGRAYSAYASDLLNNNSGLSDIKKRFVLLNSKNCLSPEQLATYRKYRHLTTETYKKLNKLNPKFETIVGKIGLKVSHEYCTAFLEMRQFQNEKEAMAELIENQYEDFYISIAKNYLSSCPKDAVLFTNGDTDTYPLLYVQAMYGFRTDVMVVNISLLLTDRYINSLRDPVLSAKPLPLSFTPDEIKEGVKDVIYIKETTGDYIDLPKMLDFIRDDKNLIDVGTSKYAVVEGKKIRLKTKEGIMEWDLPFSQYFFKNDLMALDIIAHANGRPVCFAITMGSASLLGLNDYLRSDGMVSTLRAVKKPANKEYVNTAVLYDNVMKKFVWKGNETVFSHDKLFISNYSLIFSWLASALIDEGDKTKATEALDKYFKIFPDSVFYYESSTIPLIECYFRVGKFKEANTIANTLLDNIKKGNSNTADIIIYASTSPDVSVILDYFSKIALKYKQTALFKRITEMQ